MPTKERSINFLAKHVAKPILSFHVYLNHLIPSLAITLDSCFIFPSFLCRQKSSHALSRKSKIIRTVSLMMASCFCGLHSELCPSMRRLSLAHFHLGCTFPGKLAFLLKLPDTHFHRFSSNQNLRIKRQSQKSLVPKIKTHKSRMRRSNKKKKKKVIFFFPCTRTFWWYQGNKMNPVDIHASHRNEWMC